VTSSDYVELGKLGSEYESVWQAWNLIIPRRSITGRLVWGRVWRQWDGDRWIYKTDTDW
jgi:hypothetical protein